MPVISAITGVFTEIAGWITETIPNVTEIFFSSTSGELTFLGVLAVVALGISIFFLPTGIFPVLS